MALSLKGTLVAKKNQKTHTIIDPKDLTPGEIWEAMVDTLGIPVTPEQRAKNTTTKSDKT